MQHRQLSPLGCALGKTAVARSCRRGYPRATAVRLDVRNGAYGGLVLGFAPIVEPSLMSKHGPHI